MHKLLEKFVYNIRGQKDNFIIIKSDGGICSQISFYALGLSLKEKGVKVKFDLTWFEKCGLDGDGRFARNFDLLRAFPTFSEDKSSWIENKIFKKFYKGGENRKVGYLVSEKIPNYIDGYPERTAFMVKYRDTFINAFKPVDINSLGDLLRDISSSNACAVHVRRGDLSQYNQYYGFPPDVNYFVEAIKIMQKHDGVKLFFFSDEPEYVKNEIVPHLPPNTMYRICTENGSDKGYLDLFAICQCKHMIASQGSFGPTARILSNSIVDMIIYKENSYIKLLQDHFANIFVL